MESDITITTIADSDVETDETVSVHVVPETEYSNNSDVIIVSSDSETQSSVPAAHLTKPYCGDFTFLNFKKSQTGIVSVTFQVTIVIFYPISSI